MSATGQQVETFRQIVMEAGAECVKVPSLLPPKEPGQGPADIPGPSGKVIHIGAIRENKNEK